MGIRTQAQTISSSPWEDLAVYGNRVEVATGPGRAVEGVVRDRASGLPLGGVHVIGPWEMRSLGSPGIRPNFQTITDHGGAAGIRGLALEWRIPVHGQGTRRPALSRQRGGRCHQARPWPRAGNMPLGKGVWITGKVVDDATAPRWPAQAPVEIPRQPDFANPFLRKALATGFEPVFDDNVELGTTARSGFMAIPAGGSSRQRDSTIWKVSAPTPSPV